MSRRGSNTGSWKARPSMRGLLRRRGRVRVGKVLDITRTPELTVEAAGQAPLPWRKQLVHEIPAGDLYRMSRHATLRELGRDPLYRRWRPELDRVIGGLEWDLTATVEPKDDARNRIRTLAWNVERGRYFEPLRDLLCGHPELSSADLLFLTELDVGMGRSGNRNVPRELAEALGLGYVFVNSHVVLTRGDQGEQTPGLRNTSSLHGSALLTRFPVRRCEAVDLPEYYDKFNVVEKRLGCKHALIAEVELPDGPLTVAVVHLDPFAGPRHRAFQLRRVLAALARFGGERVLIGGDFNTTTYDLGSSVGFALNFAHKMVRFGFTGTIEQYMTPDHVFERRLFEALRRAGFAIQGYNDTERGTIYYDVNDPATVAKTLDEVPKWLARWMRRRLEPWGGVVPMRFDWFAGRGLRPRDPMVIERPQGDATPVSDHNPIVVDLALDG